MLITNVIYTLKPGMREAFLERIRKEGVDTGSRAEEGNSTYNYYRAVDNENELFLYEEWKDPDAHALHRKQPHYQRLQNFQWEYLDDLNVKKYITEE